MNKLKKILSVVLSIGLVASTLVLPITAEAADGDFIHKVTFDEAADATGVFGNGDAYQVVAGTDPTTLHAQATNLNADDKIVKLTAGSVGTPANGDAGSYLFGKNWGDGTGVKHATLQFDIQATNSWNAFRVYPAGNGNDNGLKRYGIELRNAGDSRTVQVMHNSWDYIDTGAVFTRLVWHEIAIEWDLDNGVGYVYVDGNKVDTWNGISGSYTPNDFMFQMTDTANGAFYINNLYYYEGGYNANVEDPFYPYMEYDFTDAADATELTNTTQVAGLMGKAASDMVGNVTGTTNANGWGKYWTDDIVTAEAQVYVPNGKIEIYPGSNPNGEDRPGVYIQNGKFGFVKANGWVYTDLTEVDKNMWHKVAIEWNKVAGTAKLYLNGELMSTQTVAYASQGINQDIRIQNGGYIDNYLVYAGAYMGDAAITAASTSKVTVSGTTLSAIEGVTLDELKAVVANYDSIKFYTDTTLATETSDVAAAKVMLVNYGDLYKKYDVNITSPYGTKYRWYDFSTTTDITNVSNVAGIMGKDATDMVGTFTAGGAAYNWGTAYTDNVITVEAQVYAGSNKTEIYAGSQLSGEDRPGVYIQNGKFGFVKANGWVYTDICDVDKDMWHKVAYEMNKSAGTVKLYLDGELKSTQTITYASQGINQDIRAQHTGGYIDNFHVYAAPYVADAPITVASTAAVTVSGTTVQAVEGVTLDQLAATVAEGTAKFYTDTTLATETTNVSAAKVMLVNNGDLYKKYDVNITSPYGEKYRWYDFTSSSDITNGAIVNGLAGKAASDKVFNVNAGGAGYNWGSWYASKVVTIEAQILAGANKIEIYTGSNHAGEDRPGLYVQNGKVGYVNANGWAYTDVADIDSTIWNKVALTMDANNGNAKLYLNGELIGTYDVAYNSNGINQDIRVQDNGYIDNFHVYGAAYVADETIATPSAVADGTFVVANGQTLAEAAAAVTDGEAKFYVDNTYSTEATLANVGYVLINKGELYVAYPVKVASKYDGALLSTNFNAGSIDYAGDFAGNASSSWYNVNSGAVASTSYTQPGGKDSKAFTVVADAYGEGTRTNARLQTGWGSANAKYSSGTYTVEGQLYKDQAVTGGGIAIKMRNSAGANTIITLDAPAVAHEWLKLALTVDTEAGTYVKYVNGVETESGELGEYTIVSDQANLNACDNKNLTVTTSLDNFRVYAGEYKGDTMPSIADAVTMDAGATVADVIAETGADFVVTATGAVASNSALAETGMKAVAVNGECYAYCDVTATALIADVNFGTLATGTVYEKDGVEYVFVAVTTDTVNDFSLYETFACTDGVDTKGIALSELMGTTLTGAGQLGVLVMNVPAANAANFKAKLVLAD